MKTKTACQIFLLLLVFQLLGQPTALAQQQAYKFTSIADTNGPFSAFVENSFTVNTAGTVAFSAPLKAGGRGIFTSTDGISHTKIVQTGEQLEFNSPSDKRAAAQIGPTAFVNHVGLVAFNAVFSEFAEGVYIGDGGTPTKAAVPYYYSLTSPSINAHGKIAWTGFFGLQFDPQGFDSSRFYVLRSPAPGESGNQGTAGAIIAHTGGNNNITGFFSGFGPAIISDSGAVAFRATIRSGGEGIYLGKDALPDRFGPGDAKTTVVADNVNAGSIFSNFGSSEVRPDINGSNMVVFGANLKNGGHGIYRGIAGGSPLKVVDNTGAYSKVLLNPAINSAGEVLFSALRINGRAGIYKGPDPEKDVVVESGKSLFGSTLVGVATGPRTLSDNGKIAFYYQLSDGRRGLAVAIPDGEKKPTGDLVIKESAEPDSAFSTYGLYLAYPAGGQLREVSFEPEVGSEALFDVELTSNATEEETYVLNGTDGGDSGWKVEALLGATDYWAALKGGGATIKLQPGAKLRLKIRLTGADGGAPLPGNSKHEFGLTVRNISDLSFTHDAVGAIVETKFSIVVNMTADTADPNPGDELPDVDPDKPGLQTTLRCALQYTEGRAGGDIIKFKIPADDPGMANGVAVIKPKTPLPNITKTVTIDGSTQDPASATPPIELDGVDLPHPRSNGISGDSLRSLESVYNYRLDWSELGSGLVVEASGCKLRGLALIRFPFCGLEIKGSRNFIQGCHIGIDAKGELANANGHGGQYSSEHLGGRHFVRGAGIVINSSSNQIGGSAPRDRNVISGRSPGVTTSNEPNDDAAPPGVVIRGPGAFGNSVLGNYFGLDSSGEALPQQVGGAPPDASSVAGVVIYDAPANLIGGTVAGGGNFFAHSSQGVLLLGQGATANLLLGNQFGKSVSGSKDFGHTVAVRIENARNNQIGGPQAGARNRLLGSEGAGISFFGSASGNQFVGNEITNTFRGGIEFGQSTYSEGSDKIPSDNLVEANDISSSPTGAGVLVLMGTNITIKGNSIHHNASGGVVVIDGRQVQMTGNQIYGNRGLGISLSGNISQLGQGPNLNDFGDLDDGPNGKLNFPVLASAVAHGNGFRADGRLSTNSGTRDYQIEFFANKFSRFGYGEGERFLGSVSTTTTFAGEATFAFETNVTVNPGEFITATATDPEGNTSEFSKILMARSGNDGDKDSISNEIEDLVPDRGPRAEQTSIGLEPRGPARNAGERSRGSSPSNTTSVDAGFGDGNGDGVLDSQQANVASFQTILGNWVTLVSPNGTTLENIEPGGPPEFDNLPAGFTFPVGFLTFSVGGVPAGGPVAVTCILHDRFPSATAFGYGPLPGAPQPGWYQFNYDGQTGAAFGGGELVFNFVDGARGDHDLQANGRITTLLGPALSGQLLNIATRLRVQSGENVLIGGFIITGTDPKKVMIRGIGPSLAQFFSGTLDDPTLQLFQGNTPLASNNDWKEAEAEIAATGIPPTHDQESAIVYTLAPGNYTAVLQGNGGSTGIGVVEVYDLDQNTNSKLANIASRGFVDTGDNVMIGGLIVGPAGGATAKVVVRAIGPSLSNFQIAGALQDPTLDLVNSNGVVLRGNDGWKDSQQAELESIGLQPGDIREAALIETLAPGNYTAIVRGAGNTTGVGLVEVYNVQ